MGSRKRLVTAIAAMACGALVVPAAANAVTIAVNTTADESGGNVAACSLREAVTAANDDTAFGGCTAGSATDEITLIAGTFTLTGGVDDTNAGGDLDIQSDTGAGLLIAGAPVDANEQPTSIIDANNTDRALHILLDGAPDANVELLALGVRNGSTTSDGGGLLVGDPDANLAMEKTIWQGNDATDYGGAVNFDDATADAGLSVKQSEFAGNTAGDEGGGLYLDMPDLSGDEPSISNSAIVGNSAGEMGGGLYLGTRPTLGILLDIINTTISGNSATLGGGALAFDLSQDGNAYINFSTIANNTSATAGTAGGIQTVPPAGAEDQFVLLNRSIISGNTAAGVASNCVGPGNVQGGNSIESTNSCGLNAGTSMLNTDPLLAPLATNAGGQQTTRTHGLYDTSPAVDFFAAAMGQCSGFSVDQRFSARPAGSGCDVGAFEGTVGPVPTTTPPTTTPPTPTTAAKKCKKKKKKRSLAGSAKKKKGCKKKKKKR